MARHGERRHAVHAARPVLWLRAIREGKSLSAASAANYWSGGVLAGGDERDFLCRYTEGPDNLVILCGNAHTGRNDRTNAVGIRLTGFVREESAPRFALGIEFNAMSEGGVSVARVLTGSATASSPAMC